MARLRYNGLVAELGGSGLTNSATSITFAAALTHSGGTNVPTITGTDYIPLTLLDSDGVPAEIVYLTAYTAAATTGTITRGQEGTTGVVHAAGVGIFHAPTKFDHAYVGCQANRSTNQSIPSGVDTAMQYNDADGWDTDAIHDPVTNNSRMTVPANMGGIWRFTSHATFETNSTGTRSVWFGVNGVVITGHRAGAASTGVTVVTTTMDLSLAAGDYVETFVNQTSGGAKNLTGTMTAHYLGSL